MPNMAWACNEVTWLSTDRAQYEGAQSTTSPSHKLSPAGYLECYHVGISAQNAGRQDDLPMDVYGNLSPSALVALSYHSRQNIEAMQCNACPCLSSEQQIYIHDASCATHTMWDASIGTEHTPGRALGRSKSSLALFDRLCNAPPVIVDATERDGHSHMVLERFRRNPNNIVLDSLDSENAPHIVITPAEDSWATVKIMEDNRAGLQYWPWLSVLPCFGATCRLPTYEEYTSMLYASQQQQQQQDVPHFLAQHLVHWDSYAGAAENQEMPETEDNWRHFVNEISHLLTVHSQKLAAIAEVRLRAISWRERFDRPNVFESIERPFEWIDPAKFILSDTTLRCLRTSFVIESDAPFAVPHIIIHLAPANDTTTMASYINTVQDPSLLTAPPACSTTRYEYSFESNTSTCYDRSSTDITDVLSDCDTESSGPKTPTLQRIGSGFFSATSDAAEEDIVDAHGGYRDYKISASNSSLYANHAEEQSYTKPATRFYISPYDDDDCDTDSLPDIETDEWFIQARAGSAVITTSSF